MAIQARLLFTAPTTDVYVIEVRTLNQQAGLAFGMFH